MKQSVYALGVYGVCVDKPQHYPYVHGFFVSIIRNADTTELLTIAMNVQTPTIRLISIYFSVGIFHFCSGGKKFHIDDNQPKKNTHFMYASTIIYYYVCFILCENKVVFMLRM